MMSQLERRIAKLEQFAGGMVVHVCDHAHADPFDHDCCECRSMAERHALATKGHGTFVMIPREAGDM